MQTRLHCSAFLAILFLGSVIAVAGSGCAGTQAIRSGSQFTTLKGNSMNRSPLSSDLLTVRRDILDDNPYNRRYKRPGPMPEMKYITIHNTAEPFSARQERDRVNNRRDNMSVSFHFAVDENEAVQILELDEHGWHAGDGENGEGNNKSIGIEICRSQCYGESDHLYRESEENAVRLAATLLNYYALTPDDLRMHQDWSGKYCPHRILDEKSWESFKERVRVMMNRLKPAVVDAELGAAVSFEPLSDGNYCIKTFYGGLFPNVQELIDDLKFKNIQKVTVSSWIRKMDYQPVVDQLQNAGIEVDGFYIVEEGIPDWQRRNVLYPENLKQQN